jgi:peptidoglycan/LPS O-acetylase OafA/YrhL
MTALTTEDTATPSPHFPVLDTLRAVGALAVLTTHTAFQSGSYTRHGIYGALLSRLDVGVAIFFVLSGFLLARPYFARAAVGARPPGAGRYYWKRFLRIYPVYAISAALALALVPENSRAGVGDWIETLLLADIYLSDQLPYGLTQMWSLATEVAFYLILPGLMYLCTGRGRTLKSGPVAATLLMMLTLTVLWHLSWGARAGELVGGLPMNWLPAYAAWFAVGIGLAYSDVVRQYARERTWYVRAPQTLGQMPGACWVLVGGLMLVAATPLAGPILLAAATPQESLSKAILYAAVGGLVVVTGVHTRRGSTYERVMTRRASRHLGFLSYSLFCVHLLVLDLVVHVTDHELFTGNGLQLWTLTLLGSLAASEVLYRLVERPAMRFRDLGARTSFAASQPNKPEQTKTTR